MTFTENLGDFFQSGVMVETAVIGSTSVVGYYDNAYAEFVDVEGTAPAFTCKSADLPSGTTHGTAVVVSGSRYVIRNIRPDGTGITVLQLEFVS